MEIATAFGGALLSASVHPLMERMTSDVLDFFARRENIHAELKDWEMMLAEINDLLEDAEQTTSSAVKKWLAEFRDLTYDMEDVLDEFNTDAFKCNVMEDSSVFKNTMASRIKDITERLRRINVCQAQTLNLRKFAKGMTSKQRKERPPTTSLVDKSYIYGRNDEKEAIVQKLLRDEGGNNPISVIPIVGMGGIGKTTLAQLVYNDSKIEGNFNIKVWVCVSENFDVVSLTRTILQKIAPETRDLNNLDLDSLQETLKGKLSQKKFLLILDDVWEEDYNLWDLLRRPFISAASSSKIVVTTRKENAAPITGDVHVYRVKELLDDECLLLLACHALGANSFDARPDLKDIGEELVKRCNGLPLAAKVLGGLLRNKRKREQWERVLRNNWWESSNNVHPTLKLSYDDLPCHLKRCFVYCAIFPKDYEFDRDELVWLWMAEGFLHHPQGGKHMEDLGIEYFEDLVSRSFFQSSTSNFRPFFQSKLFVMHDLISDLAQTIAEDICYNYEKKKTMSSSKYEKVRHASFSFYDDSQEYEVYSRMNRLRTIWRRPGGYPDWGVYGNKMLEELSTHSKCVRVLSLARSPRTKLSNSIGDLIHLRYINLSGTDIQQLPESVSTLFNLQTLLLCYCSMLEKLPDKIGNLANLLYLDISYTDELQKLPSSIGMLTNLQTLSKFIVKEGHGTTIAELKNLNNLRGSLSIKGLENVQHAKLANLKGKQGLEELELKWSSGHGRNDLSVLESLEPPHQNLKRLTISCYGGAEFPSWMTNNIHLFSKLVSLDLELCGETILLPPLGQLCSLKELRINGLKAVKTIGVEFYGNVDVPFPSLERLKISDMPEWIEWSDGNTGGEGFPNLQELKISNCPKLIGSLPSGLHRLQHLSELEIMECGSLESFPPMGLPRCLKRIYIKHCSALECLPIIDTRHGRESLLEELRIKNCSALKYFERAIPENNTALERNEFSGVNDNMKALPSIDCLPSLRSLSISDCPAFESFPEMGFFSTTLQNLTISRCENLSLVPIPMQSHFPSLRALAILDCYNLRQPVAEWGLGMLSSLEILEVGGRCPATEDVVSFPDDNCSWLPTSLMYLDIRDFVSLESVSMGLQMLTSLVLLNIRKCPKLQSLPKDALASSLNNVSIEGCPLLRAHYLENRGEYPSIVDVFGSLS